MLLKWALLLLLARISLAIQVQVSRHWVGGFQMSLNIPICLELDNWTLHLHFSQPVESVEAFVGTVTKLSSTDFSIKSQAYNGVLHKGESLDFDLMGHGPTEVDIVPSLEVHVEGMGDCYGGSPLPPGQTISPITRPPPPHTGGGTSNKPYKDALAKSILFYDAQRSGKLPANNPIPWRRDSALNDCVVGGWYDAGDHVKFALPFGSTVVNLLWGMYKFKDGYVEAGQLDQAYDMIKWATDYMLKAWNPSTQELVGQIGDGEDDHHFWGRAEDMTMERPCYKLSPSKPGSDVAGDWAAALALGYLVFKDKGDTAYAAQLLSAAESVYKFGKENPGTYSSSIPKISSYYSSNNYKDEMCEGAMWLYKATRNQAYLVDAQGYFLPGFYWGWSWADKTGVCQLLLYEETFDPTIETHVASYMETWMPGGQVAYTPCGLAWREMWGANRYAGNSAFFALLAAELGMHTLEYRKWAVEQINYMLGDNKHDGGCFSFAIGVGSKYPKSPHHRSASCGDIPEPCSEANLHAQGPSPHLLLGALVGGPSEDDVYADNREDYVKNEVAIDYNSGYQSALAGIIHLQATGNLPPTNNKCPCTTGA